MTGYLRNAPNIDELRGYLQDFVRFVPTAIYFNGQKISQGRLSDIVVRENFTEIRDGVQEWREGDLVMRGRLFEDRGHTLTATIEGLNIGGEEVNLVGHLRFENGPIDVLTRLQIMRDTDWKPDWGVGPA